VTLLPFIVLIGAMFLMTRSAKKKQQQAAQMRDQMQPGTGVRTIGGMYATVKELHDDTVLLEVAPGVTPSMPRTPSARSSTTRSTTASCTATVTSRSTAPSCRTTLPR
jgi:preprotein translocase YajC subunit